MKTKNNSPLKVNIKPFGFLDLLAFRNLVPKRKKNFADASSQRKEIDQINKLARKLHPDRLHLVVRDMVKETETTRTFRLEADAASSDQGLAYFRAGQYLSVKAEVDGVNTSRPYSISSSPTESLNNGFYDITIKKVDKGFLTENIWENWQLGSKIECSAPTGLFYHEPIRDGNHIVGIAGGSGITPFRSFAREIVEGKSDMNLTLLYGSSDESDIVFRDELKTLEDKSGGRLKVVHIVSCENPSLEGCETGFITSEIINKYCNPASSTFFLCGPQVMYEFVEKELAPLELRNKQIRRELFSGIQNITDRPDFPRDKVNKAFSLTVHIGGLTTTIPASSGENLMVALERAELAPPSQCRSGECGFCHSQLLSGDIYVNPENDGRRAADRLFKSFYPCAAYPLSDLEISVPRN